MKPLHHPRLSDVTLAVALAALGDPIRLAMVRHMASCPQGSPMNCAKAAEKCTLPLSTRHHHLRVLREAGLIRSEKQGVQVLNTLRRDEFEERFPGLLATVLSYQ